MGLIICHRYSNIYMYKPLKLRQYLQWIRKYGWTLHKGKIDWSLRDRQGNFVCTIKIQHPGPKEVAARSVKLTEQELKNRNLI